MFCENTSYKGILLKAHRLTSETRTRVTNNRSLSSMFRKEIRPIKEFHLQLILWCQKQELPLQSIQSAYIYGKSNIPLQSRFVLWSYLVFDFCPCPYGFFPFIFFFICHSCRCFANCLVIFCLFCCRFVYWVVVIISLRLEDQCIGNDNILFRGIQNTLT